MNKKLYLLAAALIAFVLRLFFFDYASGDYNQFLKPWMDEFRANGGFAALGTTTSNYNLLYLYFLALFSYLPASFNDLYLIKLLSVAFDMVLALTMYKIVEGRSERAAQVIFAVTLFLPTFISNSAQWAQCDSIYAACCLLSYYFVMNGKPKTGVIMAGLAFAFKLQAIFYLPMFLIFLAARKVKLRHAALFPTVYAVTALPAMFLGWTPARIVGIYVDQASIYSSYLTLNAPSVFALIKERPAGVPLSSIGIVLAALAFIVLTVWAFVSRDKLDDRAVAVCALLTTLGLPWLLPSMHERYFYLAEAFALLYVSYYPKRWYIAVMTTLASAGGYWAYLVKGVLSDDLDVYALLFLEVLILVSCWVVRDYKHSDIRQDEVLRHEEG
ncbi:hypothetical protein FACS1894202_04950 [Clostridia bacterium]|nr:hypothetical protein FACS1894202_04950 [Clostridia bacterium]